MRTETKEGLPICIDCAVPEEGGYSPCVRHQGCEHGFAGFWPGHGKFDDTWEHWRRRALKAEELLRKAPQTKDIQEYFQWIPE
jgi:hypothetical protein